MVIKGNARSNARALGYYLLREGENEQVRVLEVDGQTRFAADDYRDLMRDMDFAAQLTRSKKAAYHAILSPSNEAAGKMQDKDWLHSIDILAEELGMSEQRRVVVLHRKHGHIHAHVAFERYDHEKRKMVSDSKNFSKHDRARQKLETLFEQQTTPRRNARRTPIKDQLTALWQQHPTAHTFLQAAKEQGYTVAKGYGRIPYAVVDDGGRSYNFVRSLSGIRTAAVRERLKGTVLPEERDAIALIRTKQAVTGVRPEQRPGKEKTATSVPDIQAPQDERTAMLERLANLRQQPRQRNGPRPR